MIEARMPYIDAASLIVSFILPMVIILPTLPRLPDPNTALLCDHPSFSLRRITACDDAPGSFDAEDNVIRILFIVTITVVRLLSACSSHVAHLQFAGE